VSIHDVNQDQPFSREWGRPRRVFEGI
jgi:hypothetical protein